MFTMKYYQKRKGRVHGFYSVSFREGRTRAYSFLFAPITENAFYSLNLSPWWKKVEKRGKTRWRLVTIRNRGKWIPTFYEFDPVIDFERKYSFVCFDLEMCWTVLPSFE